MKILKLSICLASLLLLGPGGVDAQRISGFDLAYDQLPQSIRDPVPLNAKEFNTRLAEGGRWEVNGDITLAPPDPTLNRKFLMALDELDLSGGGRIITNGHTLVLIVNRLKSGQGQVVSFLEDNREGAEGQSATTQGGHGGAGGRGDDGGTVSIHIVQDLEGFLTVELPGQNGGVGGDGNKGETGPKGPDGAKGKSNAFDCRSGGENGKKGGKGYPGGRGGDGGPAGAGGNLFIYTIGEPLSEAQYSFVGPAGEPGIPGSGGAGGDGGRGGKRGGGDGHCEGGKKDGDRGDAGAAGGDGSPGAIAADGTAIVEGLELEFLFNSLREEIN
ncbi:MAG: hypothetical protein AAGC60_23585 [Acidobacteriota bacterium]